MAESKKKAAAKLTGKESPKENKGSKKDFIVVGLGASAGGVQALQDFFATMPPNSGMAFVVVLHLAPNYESNLDHILQAQTQMPVIQVRETHKVEPNTVYVIPPNQNLKMVDGVVRLAKPDKTRGNRVAIDTFLRTLAEAYERNAVCVVLSGTGSDGTLGLKRVKESNGFAVVQAPEDAEYEEMPRSAIAPGLVDWVLPVAQMPEKLLGFKQSSERLHLTDGDASKVAEEINAEDSLREILTILRVRTGHDFANYKTPTLVRRIARHLQIHELQDIPTYLAFLRDNPEEIQSLQRNLLINVTNFFRDKEAFAALEKEVIPNLFAGKTSRDTVRVWSAGCASGEEAYSLAMLLHEYAEKHSDPPKLQVFATDVDDEAIAEAREHSYPETIEADVSEERLKRFFTKEGKRYRVKKDVRETVLFAPHNLLRDPPFSKLDLVSCRNLLIYINRETQDRVMEIFHFALSINGYLFLGSSETADGVPNLFTIVDKKNRIYSRRHAHHHQQFAAPQMPVVGNWQIRISDRKEIRERNKASNLGEVHYRLLERFSPPSVLVNQDFEVMYMSESVGRYLRFAGGEPSRNILKLVHPDLLPDLRAALFTAQHEKKSSEYPNLRVNIDGEETQVTLTVRAVEVENEDSGFLLVIFDEAGKSERLPGFIQEDGDGKDAPARLTNKDDAMETIVRRLEDDLSRTRAQLRSTIEQHEVSIEELKAANEELQAINEELRSAGEELETSKEELQSVNEELVTVNHELKEKIDETTRVNSDLQNLMAATDIATIFLDKNLRIKRYTPPVEEIFNITKTDVGRPLEHFTHKLSYDDLAKDAAQILKKLTPIESEISDKNNRHYLARFVPYRTLDDRIDGVVLNFIDITDRKRAEEALRESEELFRRSIVDAPIPVIMHAEDGEVLEISRPWTELTGYTLKDRAVIQTWLTKAYGFGGEQVRDAMKNAFAPQAGEPMRGVVFDITTRAGERRTWSFSASTPGTLRDGRRFVVGMAEDITDRRRAEEAVRLSEERLQSIANLVPDLLWDSDSDGSTNWFNRRWLEYTGQSFEEASGWGWANAVHPDDREASVRGYREAFENGELLRREHRIRRYDGEYRWFVVNAFPLKDESGKVTKVYGAATDIHETRLTNEALHESEERYRTLFNSIDEGFSVVEMVFDENGKAVDYIFRELNPTHEKLTGLLSNVTGMRISELMPNLEEEVLELFGKVVLTGEPARYEQYIGALDRWFDVSTVRVGGSDSRLVANVFSNITERKQREQQQEYIVRLNDALRPLADPMEIQRVAMQVLGEHLNVDRAIYAEINIDEDWFEATDNYASESVQKVTGRFPFTAFGPPGEKLEKGESLIIHDVNADVDDDSKKAFYSIDVQAVVAVPLIKQGKLVADLSVHQTTPRHWLDHEIALVKETAERTWAAVERAKVEADLRESEERLNLASNVSGFGINDLDLENNRLYWSPELKAMHGLAPEAEIEFDNFAKYVHPDDRERVEETVARALDARGDGALELEFRIVRADNNETRWLYNRSHTTFVGKGKNRKAVRNTGIVIDITERRRAESVLSETEAHLRIAVEAAELGTWDWNIERDEVFWNERHFTILGMKPHKQPLKSQAFFDRVHPEDREWVAARLKQSVAENRTFEAEFRAVCEDNGAVRWMEGYGRVVEERNGKPVRMSGVMSDITNRKLTEEAVAESSERLRLLVESTSDYAIFTTTLDNRIETWNVGAENIFGWTEKEAVGLTGDIIFTPEDRAKGEHLKELETALREGRAPDERFHLRKDGTRFYVSGVMNLLRDASGKARGFVKIARDMTERLAAETALREKETLQKLVTAQEEERKRIARDLHDELGQQLTALRIKLDAIRKNQKEPSLLNQLTDVQNIARSIDDGVDFLAWELRPSTLDDLGLTAALSNYIKQWSHYAKVKAELTISNLKRARFAPEVETCLYRIVQEALNNTHKHAEATNADVILEKRGDLLILIIEDNGKGFNQKSKTNRSKGLGLTGMKERAALVGGTLEIETAARQGTTIYVRIPFSAAQEK